MHHNKHHILLEEGGHPSMALLRQYHEDALPPDLSHQVERHLLNCEMCADVVEGMALSGADSTKSAVGDIHQRIAEQVQQGQKRTAVPVWQMAAAVLLLLCTAFVVFYYNYSKLQPEQRSLAAEQEINSSMDLSVPAAPDSALEIADAVVAAETQSIAALTPRRIGEKKNLPPIVKEDRETVNAVADDELADTLNAEEKAPLSMEILNNTNTSTHAAASPPPADATISVTESVPLSFADAPAPAIAPESTEVSMALQGKAAGVTIRGINSLKKDAAGERMVYGQVLSEDGQPLPGVTVQLKGTSTGTTTDASGNYALPIIGKKPTLLFHYIGYTAEEKAIAASGVPVNVKMEPDTRALSEVVVTGYATAPAGQAPAVVPAKPAAGHRAFKKYLRENLRLPAGSEGARGKVVVGFTVTAPGKVSEVKVLKSLCTACDTEAVRLIKEGPAWQPATQAGIPVQQQVKVSVPFRQKKP